jgi:toxin YoeB
MRIVFSENAWKDYLSWQGEDKKILKKINDLIKDISRTPFQGIGKSEPLKHNLSGFWSRRINQDHRIVYRADNDEILIYSCRFHYD